MLKYISECLSNDLLMKVFILLLHNGEFQGTYAHSLEPIKFSKFEKFICDFLDNLCTCLKLTALIA